METPMAAAAAAFDPAWNAAFRRDGFLHAPGLLDAHEVHACRAAVER